MKVRILLFSVLSIFLLAGCRQNFGESQSEGFLTIHTISQIDGAVPAELAKTLNAEEDNFRTAQPELPASILYKVTGLGAEVSFENTTENTYSLKFGSYENVSVSGYVKDSDEAYTIKAFESTESKSVVISETNPAAELSFTLKPSFGTPNGKVCLPVILEADSGISKVTAYWTENGTAKSQTLTFSSNAAEFTMEGSGETDGVQTGAYSVIFAFYKYSDNSEILSYRAVETINVFSNLTTDTWKKAGDAALYISDSNDDGSVEFYLTKALIQAFEKSVKYVDYASGYDEDSAGTYFRPFKTLQKAVEAIEAINTDSSSALQNSNFSILLKNDFADTSTSDYLAENNYSLINISPVSDLNLTITGYDFENIVKINANRCAENGNGRLMYIGDKAVVTLENIELSGGYSDEQGAGVYVASGGKLKINGTVIIDSNKKTDDSKNNVYLSKNASEVQQTIEICGAITGSSIGIQTELLPSDENPIDFTNLFGTNINPVEDPYFYFTSDLASLYSVLINAASLEACICKNSSGNLSIVEYKELKFKIDTNPTRTVLTLEIKAYLDEVDITSECTNWKILITDLSGRNRMESQIEAADGSKTNKAVFISGTPETDYRVFVSAEYLGYSYSAALLVTMDEGV